MITLVDVAPLGSYEPKVKQVDRELFVAYIAPYHYNGLRYVSYVV